MSTTTPARLSPHTPRPGAVFPLRPLAQDELFKAAFTVIRRCPRAVLGLPLAAAVVNLGVAVLLLAASPGDAYLRMLTDPMAFENEEMLLAALSEGGVLLLMVTGFVISGLAWAVSVGLLAIPVLRAAYGLPTSLRQTVGLRARRLGWLLLHLLVVVTALLLVGALAVAAGVLITVVTLGFGLLVALPALFLLLCWLTAGLMFGPLLTVVEGRNAFSAIGRSFTLNRGMWWRHIGAVALLYLMLVVVLVVTALPATLVTELGSELAWRSDPEQSEVLVLVVLGLGQLYDLVLNTLLVALIGTLISVMYLNARFRREALDVMLKHLAPQPAQTEAEAAELDAVLPGSPEHLRHSPRPPLPGARR